MTTQTQAADRHAIVTTGWTNPSNAYQTTGDNVYATGVPGKNGTVSGDFGFPSLGLSANAVITAVRLVVEWKMSASVTGAILGIQGRNNGVADSAAEATQTSITEAQTTFTFGTLPSITDLNTAGRIVGRIRVAQGNTNTAMTGSVDFVRLEVDYTPGPAVAGSAAGAGTGSGTLNLLDLLAGSAAGAGTASGTLSNPGGGATTYAQDDFSDAQTNSWGSADVGGAYTNAGTAAEYQKTGSVGQHIQSAVTTDRSWLQSVSAQDVDGLLDMAVDKITGTTSQPVFFRIECRVDATNANSYRFEIRVGFNGSINVLIRKVTAGSASTLRTDSAVLTGYAAGDVLRFRWQVQNSGSDVLLRYKLWDVTRGDSEPGSFSTDYTDTAPGSPWNAAGSFHITSQSTANFTGTFPVTFSYDNLLVTSIGGGGGGTTQNVAGSAAGAGTATGAEGIILAAASSAAGAGQSSGSLLLTLGVASVASGVGTASGALSKGVNVSSSAAGAGTASGALLLTLGVAASPAGAGTATGAATAIRGVAGTANGAGTATAAAGLVFSVQGSPNGAGQASGTLWRILSAASSATGTGQAAGAVVMTWGVSGTANGVGTAQGTLPGGGTQAVSGSATGTGNASGTIFRTIPATGSAAGAGTSSAAAGIVFSISSSAAGAGQTSGTPKLTLAAAGSATGVGTMTGSTGAIAAISGSAAGAGQASGTLAITRGASTSATGAGTMTGAVTMTRGLTGSATGTGVAGATGTLRLGLSGSATAAGAASGSERVILQLRGSAAAVGLLTGDAGLIEGSFDAGATAVVLVKLGARASVSVGPSGTVRVMQPTAKVTVE